MLFVGVVVHSSLLENRLDFVTLKVKFLLLTPLPKPWHSLLRGATQEWWHCLANTKKYNGSFQMTLYGAHIIEENGFNPKFDVIYVEESKCSFFLKNKIKEKITVHQFCQIRHWIGSLQPVEDAQHIFLQIYFMINMKEQLDQHQKINTATKWEIYDLQQLLHDNHALVILFKIE